MVGLLVAALALVAGIAVALADDRSSESKVPGAPVGAGGDYDQAAVPRGPYLDFCPSQEQTEAHWERYGFDYKPLVTCKGDEEVGRDREPPFGLSEEEFDRVLREDGQHQLDELVNQERRDRDAAQSRRERDEMRSARWLPDQGGQGCGYSGVLPDGKPIHVRMMVCVPGRDAQEFLDEAYGP